LQPFRKSPAPIVCRATIFSQRRDPGRDTAGVFNWASHRRNGAADGYASACGFRLRVDGDCPSGKDCGQHAAVAFSLAVVFVFLLLAAQDESVLLPMAVILIVPMCLFAAISGVLLHGMDNNILTQIGFVVLIGLAAKNAILIVEFARQAEEHGPDRFDAAAPAARTRLRPILMTSFAFILGVVPLVVATGAGAEMRQALGTAVFFGMLGVTLFGLLFTPVFYVVMRWVGVSLNRPAYEQQSRGRAPGDVQAAE